MRARRVSNWLYLIVGAVIGIVATQWLNPVSIVSRQPADQLFSADQRCTLTDPSLRMHRLHMIFNDRGRQVQSVSRPADTQNMALAFTLSVADMHLGRPVAWSLAETWEDYNFGTQYLLSATDATGQNVQVWIKDDRRHQPVVITDDASYKGRITVILALFNRGSQLRALAGKLMAMPRDPSTRLCVADFSSNDIDVAATLESTGFSFELITMPGNFSKTEALNACLATVTDPDELVFTTDVDVMLPPDAFARIRRYARPHERIYTPVVWYEECEWGGNSGHTNCWGDGGYGLVAFSRGDADLVGGYDSAHFNEREGFEDTDFLLRLLRLPRVIVRKREPDFVHLAHPRSAWKDAKNRGDYRDVDLPPVC